MDTELATDTFRRRRTAELATVRDIDDALSRYNLDRNDRINRREQVQMYREIEQNIKNELQDLSSTRRYDEADDLASRLQQLRREFEQLQLAAEARAMKEQVDIFEEASGKLLSRRRAESAQQSKRVEQLCKELEEATQRLHEIQRENLELEIQRTPMPRTKYSKRCQELQQSEQSLIALREFEEAKKVRRMLDRIQPQEERRFKASFDAAIARKRTLLAERHAADLRKLDEKIKAIQWSNRREQEKQMKLADQTLRNIMEDMRHAHKLETLKRPEMTVDPSPALQRRPGFHATSSVNRGNQLLGKLRGSQTNEDNVYVSSLVAVHDFENADEDVIILS